jgi:hypothetical protein
MPDFFSAGFDAASLERIKAIAGFPLLLDASISIIETQGADLITARAIANTWAKFKNPSGYLASTIHPVVQSPTEQLVQVDALYGHRREFSFKGPDALGRYFPNDPAAYYLTDATAQSVGDILQLAQAEIQGDIARIAA